MHALLLIVICIFSALLLAMSVFILLCVSHSRTPYDRIVDDEQQMNYLEKYIHSLSSNKKDS